VWVPNGSSIVYFTAQDNVIWLAPADGGAPPRRVLENARDPVIAPGGTLMAYASVASGRSEVYVSPFPQPLTGSPVSTDGGRFPRWSSKGDELFFPCGPAVGDDPQSSRDLCVSAIDISQAARRGLPARLFNLADRDLRATTYGQRGYDIAPDGNRILVQTTGLSGTPAITLIENVGAWLQRTLR
jgi:hypothetical protein